MAAFLRSVIKSDACKAYWAPVQQQIDQQKAALEKARDLAKKQMWKEAVEQYDAVLVSATRVADFYDEAAKEAAKAAKKADEKK